jgi:hypothetical protein
MCCQKDKYFLQVFSNLSEIITEDTSGELFCLLIEMTIAYYECKNRLTNF